jgi:L-ascorbate metabolism protein UlaG (beta-lactamase superfamily)
MHNGNNKIAPTIHKGRFYNYPHEQKSAVIIPSIYMFIKSAFRRIWEPQVDITKWTINSSIAERSKELVITWIGHATFLIQVDNLNIITDPVFHDISLFFSRIIPAGITLGQLPPIDYVLISHNHHDHMEEQALEFLKKQKSISFLVPKGLKNWFTQRNYPAVTEYTWWEQVSFGAQLTFTFLPARHWSQRGFFDYNKTLWGSWLIESGNQRIYFAGDTAYGEHFKQIAEEFSNISVVCMPIGPCEPRPVMLDAHVSAEEAGQAFLDLKARHFIPMHWGTFYFGLDKFSEPLDRLNIWWQAQKFKQEQLHAIKIGQSIILDNL